MKYRGGEQGGGVYHLGRGGKEKKCDLNDLKTEGVEMCVNYICGVEG